MIPHLHDADMRTLILIPTELERRQLVEPLAAATTSDDRVELCGFGPIAAAARTATLLAKQRPQRVLLVGIAGAVQADLRVGDAVAFGRVACYGVGAGGGATFVPAAEMGWPQWPGDPACEEARVGDVLLCGWDAAKPRDGEPARERLLLTACAASASDADVTARRRLFPEADAEDMEGFGVAAACRMAGVPLAIVRGLSNQAGHRDTASWKVAEALAAAGRLAINVLRDQP